MNLTQGLQILTGLGLFLFSLRFLSHNLGESLNRTVRPWLSRVIARPFHCFLMGLGMTALVQASSITVMTCMGLLNTFVITLEQAYLMVLGASLGTTLKAWFFNRLIETHAGAVLVGVCSVALLFIHQKRLRNLLEIAMAIGFAFLGLQLLTTSLGNWEGYLPFLRSWLHSSQEFGFSTQALAILVGMLLTLMSQSSSTVVFLILHLAGRGQLDFITGSALILGANLGTPFQSLIAAIEYEKNVRRLALGYFLIKAGGVFCTLLFFSLFLMGVDRLVPGQPQGKAAIMHLAGSHFLFNLCTVLAAWLFMPFILQLLFLIIPGQGHVQNFFLNPVVRRMLRQSPEKSFHEITTQSHRLLQLTMEASEQLLRLLYHPEQERISTSEQGLRFQMTQEGIYELLVPLCRHPLTPSQGNEALKLLQRLQACGKLHGYIRALYKELQEEMTLHGYRLPTEIRALLPEFHAAYHQLWLNLFQGVSGQLQAQRLQQILQQLDEWYLRFEHHSLYDAPYFAWLHQCLAELWHLLYLTVELFAEEKSKNIEPTPNKPSD